MKDWLSEKELDERAATPCYHQYVRLWDQNSKNGMTQLEAYRCKECGKYRQIERIEGPVPPPLTKK